MSNQDAVRDGCKCTVDYVLEIDDIVMVNAIDDEISVPHQR